jgi:hypothetical protein
MSNADRQSRRDLRADKFQPPEGTLVRAQAVVGVQVQHFILLAVVLVTLQRHIKKRN